MFVANFIGKMNFFSGTIQGVQENHCKIQLEHSQKILDLFYKMNQKRKQEMSKGKKIILGSRPEKLTISADPEDGLLPGRIRIIQNLGKVTRYEIAPLWNSKNELIEVDMEGKLPGVKEGDTVHINFDRKNTLLFSGKKAI